MTWCGTVNVTVEVVPATCSMLQFMGFVHISQECHFDAPKCSTPLEECNNVTVLLEYSATLGYQLSTRQQPRSG